jgi:hypothetical protein
VALVNDPIDFLLDADGDLTIADGDLVFSTGLAAVVQIVKLAVGLYRGEWFLDLDEGVPYIANDVVTESEALLGSKFNELRARTVFRDAILAAPGVVALTSLAVSFVSATRTMVVEFRVRTEFGDSDTVTVEVV